MPDIRHKYVSAAAQSANALKVRKNDWNDAHTFAHLVAALAVDTVLVWGTHETVLASAGGVDITLTLPTAVGHAGERMRVKKVTGMAGNIVIDTHLAENIEGAANYTLYNQYQFVELESDGANWFIWSQN
ncbi:MAG: hypothetical protein M3P27_02940 [Acidobacteriota bacterium]|nr:hypothetical protein [Acidobacteriota bacterium]